MEPSLRFHSKSWSELEYNESRIILLESWKFRRFYGWSYRRSSSFAKDLWGTMWFQISDRFSRFPRKDRKFLLLILLQNEKIFVEIWKHKTCFLLALILLQRRRLPLFRKRRIENMKRRKPIKLFYNK